MLGYFKCSESSFRGSWNYMKCLQTNSECGNIFNSEVRSEWKLSRNPEACITPRALIKSLWCRSLSVRSCLKVPWHHTTHFKKTRWAIIKENNNRFGSFVCLPRWARLAENLTMYLWVASTSKQCSCFCFSNVSITDMSNYAQHRAKG